DPVRLAVGEVPVFLLAQDFDGDGRLDLATSNYVSHDVSLLFGQGDGTFRPEVRVATGVGASALAVADFNRDGLFDLALVHPLTHDVSIRLQEAGGAFAAPLRFAVGRSPQSIVAQDFNGDGLLDLAVVNNNNFVSRNDIAPFVEDVSVLLGRGDGTFADQVRYPVGYYPTALVAADFNLDGQPDLVAVNQFLQQVSPL